MHAAFAIPRDANKDMQRFWRRVHLQAWADAREYVRTRLGYAAFLLAIPFVVVLGVRFFGTSDGWIDDLVGALTSIAVLAVIFGWIYGRNIFRTAPRLYEDLAKKWRKSQAQIANLEHEILRPPGLAELRDEIERLRIDSEPRIRFINPFFEEGKDPAFGRAVFHYLYLAVRNSGNRILERCLVKVERVQVDDEPPCEIQSALATKARREDGVHVGRFFLSPGERKPLLFVFRDASDLRRPGTHKIMFESRELSIYRGHSCIVDLIAVADVGMPDRMRVRLSVDNDYGLTCEVLPPVDDMMVSPEGVTTSWNSSKMVVQDRQLDVARALDEYFATGVKERNRLLNAVAGFNYAVERERLVDWSNRTLEAMESEFVMLAERSTFRTLDRFTPEPMGTGAISEPQLHIQTMWTEKLKRLRAIIDRMGADC
jgi:hypothetical protein